jgi:ABC-type oligopeptide transport system substrate-binding subunit
MRSLFTVDYPDPNNLLAQVWWSQEQGFGRQDWSNNVFDQLVDRAAAEMNTDRRMALYRDAERLLLEEAGGVLLAHPLNLELRKPWLKGLKKNKAGYSYFTWDNSVHTNMYITKH